MSSKHYKNVPDDVLEEYQEVFDSYDVDGNGVIEKKEMETILQRLGQPARSEQIELLFKKLNTNNDSVLSFDEFIDFMREYHLSKNKTNTNEVVEAFQVFDKNNNGVLSIRELKHILTNLGNKFSEEEVEEIFKEVDLDQDGNISYREFVEFWQEQ